jgi:hypothetical protein
MADEEFVSKADYPARVKAEHRKLLIQTVLMVAISVAISLFFFVQVNPATPEAI